MKKYSKLVSRAAAAATPTRAKMASRATGVLAPQLLFDGSEDKYDLWETRFLGCLHTLKLKETILNEPAPDANAAQLAEDARKNADCYAELIRLIDDKSLSLVRHEAADDGRKALRMLKEHYSGKSKPRIINLYTSLTKLRMADNENVTDYLIKAENTITALRDAGETLSDGLTVAMILNGLPDSFKPLAVHVTQNEGTVTFTDFKRRLRIYEESEKMNMTVSADNVMKMHVRQGHGSSKTPTSSRKDDDASVTCYRCGMKGHKARKCYRRVWCGHCKNNTHQESLCKKKGGQDNARKVVEEQNDDQDHFFKVKHIKNERLPDNVKKKGIMVDAGATSHIVNDIRKFKSFDSSFQPETHSVELADGTKCSGIAQQRGTAMICLLDNAGRQHSAQLRDALYMPSYPQDIFSVARATNGGATITFKKGDSRMITKDSSRFDIHENGNLYYLPTVEESVDKCKGCHDIQTWHEILGHCNYDDVQKLQGVVKGMEIKGGVGKPAQLCEVCTHGKFTQTRNREPDRKAKKPLELVHTDLAGPMQTQSIEGHKYAQSFTDDYSGTMFVYFLKSKSDAVQATEKFLADVAPYGEVKCIRSDNGTEFTCRDFQTLLTKNKIRHETSAPYSPHQNGTAERGWRTLCEMSRCLLLESQLPNKLWNYAMQTAAYVRNRCYSRRTKKTPYELFTGREPNIAKLQKFGSTCFAYKQEKGKLDSRCQEGIFIGYDKNSPAYLVYYLDSEKVQKHRLVKFTTKTVKEKETQTSESYTQYGDRDVQPWTDDSEKRDGGENVPDQDIQGDISETLPEQTECIQPGKTTENVIRRNPPRIRKKPVRLQEFETEDAEDKLQACVDSCYRAICDIPQTYQDAIVSTKSRHWKNAMNDEMRSLEENETFSLTKLPPGKQAVGGRWVYTLKSDIDGSDRYKARFVAKGYSQKPGTDYEETFSPTADMTSVRVVMQKAAQENLILHQMDVKTAYLHAPIDREIYIQQPEGYEKKSEADEMLVWKLQKSLYGLKQSGRNWNAMLHTCLSENGFVQNPADHCVYTRENQNEKVILIIWVDDLILAASDESVLKSVKSMLTERFQMKDLGKMKHFLGIDFDQAEGQVKMSQKKYISKILERFEMQDCKSRETPCELKLEYTENAEKMKDPRKYREAVGSLIYLSTCTRPDINFVVSKLSQHFAEPTLEHWSTVKHVLRYLKGTAEQELCFKRNETEKLGLRVYSDADWASDVTDRRSTTGYCVSLSEGSSLISWKTRKQPTVALSTCEAEYMSLASAIQECIYLEQLLQGIDNYQYAQTKVYEDNQGTIALSRNPVNRQRCKHIDIKYHFIRETVNAGKVILEYCPTEQMIADVMTKPATKLKLKKFAQNMFGT